MSNTKISKVNAFKFTKKIREAAALLATEAAKYAKALKVGELAKAVKVISDTWDLFDTETGGSKVQFAIRLDKTCPTHRDKHSKDSDGKPGYTNHAMYNAIRNATTRAVASGKSASTVGYTAEEGLLPKLYLRQAIRYPDYTPEMFTNDLTETGMIKSDKAIKNVRGFCQARFDNAVSHGDIVLPPTPEEIAAEEALIQAEIEADQAKTG
jgi:hypothetical protein